MCSSNKKHEVNSVEINDVKDFVSKLFVLYENGNFDSLYVFFDSLSQDILNKDEFIRKQNDTYKHYYRRKNFSLDSMNFKKDTICLSITCDKYTIPFNVSNVDFNTPQNHSWQFKERSSIDIWRLYKVNGMYNLRIIQNKSENE